MTGRPFQGWVSITSAPGYTGFTQPGARGRHRYDGGSHRFDEWQHAGTRICGCRRTYRLAACGNTIHLPMFGAWLDGNSSSGDPFGQSASASSNLPIGVWEATHYAGNGNNNNGAGGSFADSSGSGQGSSNSSDTGAALWTSGTIEQWRPYANGSQLAACGNTNSFANVRSLARW